MSGLGDFQVKTTGRSTVREPCRGSLLQLILCTSVLCDKGTSMIHQLKPLPIPSLPWTVDRLTKLVISLPCHIPIVRNLLLVSSWTSTTYNPQTDGQTEVLNRCLETYLRCFCTDAPANWGSYLALVEWCDSESDVVEDFMLSKQFKLELAKFHLHRAQQRMSAQANTHKSDRHFQVGDWVYVKLQPYRQSSLCIFSYHKLTSRYFGPYPVVEKIGVVAYKLLFPPEVQIHPIFHTLS
ncbi:hypothetical protein KY290_021276 [Solanum tuberosum]|uniref:Tf2-1-like SH3-like domain-containing protein n=1 Tax=Solanum tuberosum TaxID=4113 RepID=A0ABQ7V229_SOLTU|nr:hypothetical protein KY285_020196 [Solanum tuberosum]KAH0757783.1 hypothetical protein KY290_021276 [Solanum tuberosum]